MALVGAPPLRVGELDKAVEGWEAVCTSSAAPGVARRIAACAGRFAPSLRPPVATGDLAPGHQRTDLLASPVHPGPLHSSLYASLLAFSTLPLPIG